MRIHAVMMWPVWRERRLVLAVLAVVELLAVAAPIATWSLPSWGDLVIGLFLASLSVTYSLFVLRWEKARRYLLYERQPAMTPNLQTTWCFAGALVLPPSLAAVITGICFAGGWSAYNPLGNRRLYRFVYSTMAEILAATTSSWVFRLNLPLVSRMTLAAGAWILIAAGATTLAMCAAGDLAAARMMMHFRAHRLELITMGVATGEYATHWIGGAPLMWLSLPAAVAIQRYFTKAELQARDVTARPMDQKTWLHVAGVVVEASVTTTVLRIDASDSQAAHMVAMMQGGCDAIGSFAQGLAILLPDCPPVNGDALARRLRIAMKHHKVQCNIASASKARDGQVLEDLLAVCEAELVVSREASNRSAESF